MANNYLNSVLGVLSAVQARQISELLQDLQAAGTVRDPEEYADKLTRLAAQVNDRVPKPSFTPIYSLIWHLCSSDAHNMMVKAIKNDLEAGFVQINEMGEKLDDHHILFMKNLLSDLERGLKKHENTIRRLEWLADKNNEYTDALVNTFSSSSLFRVSRADPEAEPLFFDNRTGRLLSAEEIPSAVISESESLVLDTEKDKDPRIDAVSVKLQADEYSYNTERKVDEESEISNIIDGKLNTFWTYSVYLVDPVPEVHTVLDFSLGVAKDINYIVIEPASSEPFFVVDITGIAANGDRVNLLYENTEVNGKTRIDFVKTNLVSVLVTLAVKTSHRAEYFVRDGLPSIDPKNDGVDRNNAIASAVHDSLNSDTVASICNVPEPYYAQTNHNVYSFALDNIWFGNSLYSSTGIFVSRPLSIVDVGVIATSSNEKAETGIVRNTIEYDLVKIDRSPKYSESKIAIPYLGQTTVNSERLVLTKRSSDAVINNIGRLRFLPDTESSVQVYKNGELLPAGDGWEMAVSQVLEDMSDSTFNWVSSLSLIDYASYYVSPLGFYIKINNVDSRAVYTVDYTIFHSDLQNSSGVYKTVWLDRDKKIYLSKEGEINFIKDTDYYIESDIYLQVTLRRNKPSRAETPELYEYAILANKYNE